MIMKLDTLTKLVIVWCATALVVSFVSMADAAEYPTEQVQLVQVAVDSGMASIGYVLGYLAVGLIVVGLIRLILIIRG